MRLAMQQYKEIDYKTIKYEIAKLDREIIFRLVRRFKYQALARKIESQNCCFNSVENLKITLEQRKAWATSAGLNHNTVYKLSQYLIDYYLTK